MLKYLLISILTLILIAVACSDNKKPTQPTPQLPSLSVQDYTVIEGGTALFTVLLSKVTDHPVTFTFETVDGTAKAGTDYTLTSGTDTILTGEISATVLVVTIDDAVLESAEAFSLLLTSATGATVADGIATCTINDNETAQVSFATQVRPILKVNCAKLGLCHASTIAGGGLYVDTAVTYDTVMMATGTYTGGKVIVPDTAASSSLYVVTTSGVSVPFSRMPTKYGLDSLTTVQQNLLRDWINQGALDN